MGVKRNMNDQGQIPDYVYMERYMRGIMKQVYIEKLEEYKRKINFIITRLQELDDKDEI